MLGAASARIAGQGRAPERLGLKRPTLQTRCASGDQFMRGQTAPFFKVLVHGRGPVKYHRVGFDETFSWPQHQKLKPIVGDCILIDGGIR